jgi:hypothetical protein
MDAGSSECRRSRYRHSRRLPGVLKRNPIRLCKQGNDVELPVPAETVDSRFELLETLPTKSDVLKPALGWKDGQRIIKPKFPPKE